MNILAYASSEFIKDFSLAGIKTLVSNIHLGLASELLPFLPSSDMAVPICRVGSSSWERTFPEGE